MEPRKHANSSATLWWQPCTNEIPINGSWNSFISTPPARAGLEKCKLPVAVPPLPQSPFECYLKCSCAISSIWMWVTGLGWRFSSDPLPQKSDCSSTNQSSPQLVSGQSFQQNAPNQMNVFRCPSVAANWIIKCSSLQSISDSKCWRRDCTRIILRGISYLLSLALPATRSIQTLAEILGNESRTKF